MGVGRTPEFVFVDYSCPKSLTPEEILNAKHRTSTQVVVKAARRSVLLFVILTSCSTNLRLPQLNHDTADERNTSVVSKTNLGILTASAGS
jgi:hypothetical protein